MHYLKDIIIHKRAGRQSHLVHNELNSESFILQLKSHFRDHIKRWTYRRGSLVLSSNMEGVVSGDGQGPLQTFLQQEMKRHSRENQKSYIQSSSRIKPGCSQMWRVQPDGLVQANFTEQISSAGVFLQMPSQRHHQVSDTVCDREQGI